MQILKYNSNIRNSFKDNVYHRIIYILVIYGIIYSARNNRYVSFAANFVIFLYSVCWIHGWLYLCVRTTCASLSLTLTGGVRLRFSSSPAPSENPPRHRATPVFLGAKRNYTRGLSAVFVFPFFPVSFRSFARGDRWTTEAGRNQPRRAKSRSTDGRSREKIVENTFYFCQERVQFRRINWRTLLSFHKSHEKITGIII